jgi:sugar/nucleoside kinase (ribokinase family)
MFDITLYGHLTNDHIFDGQEESMTLGGIANCWRTLTYLDNKISIGMSPSALGEANIYLERKQCKRNSLAELNKETFDIQIRPAKISHVMYLNELHDTSFIEKLEGVTSSDLCKGSEVDYELLKHFDYVFVANDEGHDIEKIRWYANMVIVHSPEGSVISVGEIIQPPYMVHKMHKVENANVLGAGDMFASCFLYAIHNKWSLEGAREFAHIKTTELIRKYND